MSTCKTADMYPGDLLGDRLYEFRVSVAKAGDTDAGEEVEIAAAVDVHEGRTLAMIDSELAEECHALRARREMLELRFVQHAGARAGGERGRAGARGRCDKGVGRH